MRLAFDARMATWGGVGTYTSELLAALARSQAELGIEKIVAFRAPDDAFLEDLGLGVGVTWKVAPGSPWSPAANARLGLAARGRADVFHATHFPTPLGFDGPLVTTIHDLIPLLVPDSMPDPRRRAVYAGMVRLAVTRSSVVICVTRAAAATVAERFAGVRLRVIHHGLGSTGREAPAAGHQVAGSAAAGPAVGRASSDTPTVLARHGLAPGYVLWVGAFKPHKDVPTLLAAHRLLPPEIRDRHPLVLVGDDQTANGQALHAAEATRATSGADAVRFLGPVATQDLPAVYSGAAVFAFPSRIEGFGLPPIEAMAHGVPVVTSGAAPMPEVLGDAATYFVPGNAEELAARLLDVLTEPASKARLQARGEVRARRYSWEQAASETVAAYGLALRYRRSRRWHRNP